MMKISVVIPAYNSEKYIRECLESVLSQTYRPHEIIVVDDGSVDNTKTIVMEFGREVEYIHQKNQGPSAARNTGITYASGEWIAFNDSDDIWMPDKLLKQMQYQINNPLFSMIISDMYEGEDPDCNKESVFKRYDSVIEGSIFDRLLRSSYIFPSTVLINKKCILEFNGFDPNLNMLEDLDLFLRIANKYQIGVLNEILVFRRRHDQNISKSLGAFDRRVMFWKKTLHEYPTMSKEQVRSVSHQINTSIWDSGYDYFNRYMLKESANRFAQSIMQHYKILSSFKYLLLSCLPSFLLKFCRNRFGN